ncbi:hypothetical protein [Azospirillum doebereinerae]|uniref:Uncharacterized protein n=1 Tax=Azospirillum doebereinerae TaxID=92933 RepID=A0A3S0WQ09_9PROT|nr:hypothetical protein [Azospirillum doebereinerae]RUQ75941.1 hypothetical protein EJ913_02170 [Azospirillum doebereinerae]
MSLDVTADTSLADLDAHDPVARRRLAMLHPAFGPEAGLPLEASLGAVAEATGLPLAAVLATAGGAIRVLAPEGGCGCGGGSCGTGATTH